MVDRPYLVHGLAIHDRLRRPGLVADYTGHSGLAILSGPGSGRLRARTRIPVNRKSSAGNGKLCTVVHSWIPKVSGHLSIL